MKHKAWLDPLLFHVPSSCASLASYFPSLDHHHRTHKSFLLIKPRQHPQDMTPSSDSIEHPPDYSMEIQILPIDAQNENDIHSATTPEVSHATTWPSTGQSTFTISDHAACLARCSRSTSPSNVTAPKAKDFAIPTEHPGYDRNANVSPGPTKRTSLAPRLSSTWPPPTSSSLYQPTASNIKTPKTRSTLYQPTKKDRRPPNAIRPCAIRVDLTISHQ